MPYLASASHVPSVGVSRSSVGAAIVLPSRKPPVTNRSEGSNTARWISVQSLWVTTN